MKKRLSVILLVAAVTAASANSAQDLSRYGDDGLRAELASIAEAEVALLVPMRDGVGLSTNIWRPRGAKGPLPTILWKTPYNEHVLRGSTARFAAEAVRNGYAFIVEMLFEASRRGCRIGEVPIIFVERRLGKAEGAGADLQLLDVLLQYQGVSTHRYDGCTKGLGSRVEAFNRHVEIIEKAPGLPGLGVYGDTKAGRVSLAVQIEMLTGRFRTTEDAGPAPEVSE